MFSRSKKEPETKKKRDLSAYGLFDIPDDLGVDDNSMNDSGDDSDLEAELAAINAGIGGGGRPKAQPKPKPQVPDIDLDRMVEDSLRDIDSDDDGADGNDDDDPDLLDELTNLTGVPDEDTTTSAATTSTNNDDTGNQTTNTIIQPTSTINMTDLLKSRLNVYKIAEQNAKSSNDASRARRFNRGIKTIEGLLKQAIAGKTINMEDIPPEISVKPAQPTPATTDADNTQPLVPMRTAPALPSPSQISPTSRPISLTSATSTPQTPTATIIPTTSAGGTVDQEKVQLLVSRQQEYKTAALAAKKAGDTQTALNYVKVVKLFDNVLKAARNGEPVDLSDMPPSPQDLKMNIFSNTPTNVPEPAKEESERQRSTEDADSSQATGESLITANTVLEALEQRFEKYKSVEQAAKDEGNTSKARRLGRIVKQYQDAIKLCKAGKPIAFDELPTPPGFGPIPGTEATTSTPAVSVPSAPSVPVSKPSPQLPKKQSEPSQPSQPSQPQRPPLRKQDSRISGNHSNTSVMNRNIEILMARQKEFKDAAIDAKKSGEIEQAKEYLKIYKGFESLLDAARGGLPIDFTTLPIPPSQRSNLEDSFTLIHDGDVDESETHSDLNDICARLEEQLHRQLAMCKTTRDHHKALGDVVGTNRFENLALSVQKDLDIIRLAKRKAGYIPKFHYEEKSFNIVKCNTDLTECELEISVIRGISYNVQNPKDVDTYVKVEFPYPQETPYRNKTQVIRDTDGPEYNEVFKADIQPKVKTCQRVFKRHGIKFEVYSKGGFFRGDTLIGTVTVKLQPLETSCEIHDSFDLMDGRKTTGGKLEIKIRIRNPILTKQIEHIQEKWLIID